MQTEGDSASNQVVQGRNTPESPKEIIDHNDLSIRDKKHTHHTATVSKRSPSLSPSHQHSNLASKKLRGNQLAGAAKKQLRAKKFLAGRNGALSTGKHSTMASVKSNGGGKYFGHRSSSVQENQDAAQLEVPGREEKKADGRDQPHSRKNRA